jgi:hypothetical protein
VATDGTDLEFEFDAGGRVSGLDARQSLYVAVKCPRRDLGAAVEHGVDQCIVDEDVLVLGLYHIVALRPQNGHVTVYVNSPLVPDALEHGIDDDDGTSATDSGAAMTGERKIYIVMYGRWK